MNNHNINLADLTYDAEEEYAIIDVLKSGWLSMGPVTQSFEKEFAEYIGATHVIAVSNCTSALHLALVALGIGSEDEVIVPSLTFMATINAVLYTRAKPIFVDIKSLDDWTMSPESIQERITSRTRAIIVMHYAGFPCDMKAIQAIADKHNLYIVEDAAHGPGSMINSKQIGAIGDIGCFSFFANKNMTTGEGGAAVTNSDKLAKKMRYLRSHGMTTLSWDRHQGHAFQYDIVSLGFNYRFDDMRAALARIQLKKLPQNNKKRSEKHAYYREMLQQVPGIKIPFSKRTEKVAHHIFPILLNEKANRLELMKKLKSLGIQTSVHYPPVHLQSIYSSLRSGHLPYTEIVGQRELTLPLHPFLDLQDIDYIVTQLKELC